MGMMIGTGVGIVLTVMIGKVMKSGFDMIIDGIKNSVKSEKEELDEHKFD